MSDPESTPTRPAHVRARPVRAWSAAGSRPPGPSPSCGSAGSTAGSWCSAPSRSRRTTGRRCPSTCWTGPTPTWLRDEIGVDLLVARRRGAPRHARARARRSPARASRCTTDDGSVRADAVVVATGAHAVRPPGMGGRADPAHRGGRRGPARGARPGHPARHHRRGLDRRGGRDRRGGGRASTSPCWRRPATRSARRSDPSSARSPRPGTPRPACTCGAARTWSRWAATASRWPTGRWSPPTSCSPRSAPARRPPGSARALPQEPDGSLRVDEHHAVLGRAPARAGGRGRRAAPLGPARLGARRALGRRPARPDGPRRGPARLGRRAAVDPAPYVFSTQLGHELALFGVRHVDDEVVLRGDPAAADGWARAVVPARDRRGQRDPHRRPPAGRRGRPAAVHRRRAALARPVRARDASVTLRDAAALRLSARSAACPSGRGSRRPPAPPRRPPRRAPSRRAARSRARRRR